MLAVLPWERSLITESSFPVGVAIIAALLVRTEGQPGVGYPVAEVDLSLAGVPGSDPLIYHRGKGCVDTERTTEPMLGCISAPLQDCRR